MALKENYKDDILDVSVNTKRKYRMTDNGDGTVSLDDETVYTQEGDSFGASDMNATNGKVNALETDIGEINDNLTCKGPTTTRIRNATDLKDAIDIIIADENLAQGETRRFYVNVTNVIATTVEITRGTDSTARYTGTCISAYTGERNTFYKNGGASTVVSPFSSLEIDLLWTNPNPTSQLSAITLNINLSEYDALKIYYVGNSTYINDNYTNYGIALVAKGSVITIGGRFPNDANISAGGRNITVDNSSIVISNANTRGQVDNSWGVPLKIWGIKSSLILDELLATN